MKQTTGTWLTLGGLCTLLLLAGFVAVKVSMLDSKITQTLARIVKMQISEEVTNSDGTRTATITTTREEDEDVATWLARHDEAVTAFENS